MIINRLDMYRTTTRHLIHGPDYAKQNVDLIGNVIGNVTSHVTGIISLSQKDGLPFLSVC